MNYVEGQNLVVKLGLAEGRPERLPGLIAELLHAKVEVIVTTSTQETQAAMKATSTIPIYHDSRARSGRAGAREEPGATRR